MSGTLADVAAKAARMEAVAALLASRHRTLDPETADFFFVPGTNDTHIFMTRTEESEEGVLTFASVVDLSGAVLMEEHEIAKNRKFEGACLLPPDWLK